MSRRNQGNQLELYGKTSFYNMGNVAAAPSIDASLEEAIQMTLTANAVIAAPAANSIPSVNVGSRLYLVFIQGPGGTFTVAWNAAWRNAPALAGGAAATRASAEFRWDGASWQFIGGSTVFA
jgi:hypothetical protein